ncbi:MAG: mercury(II) reductase [Gemmatimonadaceae bacterium]|nr:mercury(II) reductase [Gemmatimonadaceae bacterium]NUS97492.1 mercury(II) reductase [Gemmatimonadaceae bacterium]
MKLDLKVSGMTCLDCSRHVTRALERVEGVQSATVDYRAGSATLEVSPSIPVAALITAVERAGYHAELANEAPTSTATSPSRPVAGFESLTVRQEAAGVADFDVLIIGTGGAGVAAAIQAAGMGAKVAIVEASVLGGTCVNVGCIPSKNLIEAAARYHDARTGFPGVAPCTPSLDWKAVLAQKNELVADLRQAKYADVLASYPGVAILAGHAVLAGGGRVRVGDVEHRARKIIIATGASPSNPPIEGLEDVDTLTSTTAMELDQLPTSLLVIGGSAIGLELGQMFARFGVKVTIVELAQRILPNEDEAVSESLKPLLVEEGLEIHTGMTPTRVEKNESGIVLHVSQGSLTGELRAERVLVAAGRRPNTEGLGLSDAGVRTTPNGYIEVDATMRCSTPDIYAAGDVTGGPGYVYVAAAGGRVAAENAVRSLASAGTASADPQELDLSAVPNVTFTAPQVGSVGLSEASARGAGYNVQVSTLDMAQVPRAIVSRATGGMVKIVSDAASGRILGVHAVGPHAGDLMGEATLAVRFGLTARDLAGTLHPYLTWAESMKLAAQGFSMDVSKLSCCA